MTDICAALITKALDGLHQRYLFTAQNIANANSPNYRPMRVSFEESLRAAAPNGLAAIDAVTPRVYAEPALSTGTPEMRLDMELATASQTAMRYRALIDILGRQMALQRAVVAAGR